MLDADQSSGRRNMCSLYAPSPWLFWFRSRLDITQQPHKLGMLESSRSSTGPVSNPPRLIHTSRKDPTGTVPS